MLKEADILSICNPPHPNIIRMTEMLETPTHYYMILDLIQGKDLFDYLAERNYSLGETRTCQIIY